ncbi:hypothetical protein [Streptomyces carpinensis]|uniref:Uncharacterized protein n=1 Tax=Streptomyces carpinensis TaxID=66369 RepID=A0ABV1VWR3_9ACTN|nr:hypothetical protein [Streptomyces carpinensis]
MAGKQLSARNATITTAAVEVKALTISGKQVTLAVFRQLKEEPLIAEDGTLNGEPWGIVNYHPDKCGDAPEHLHVVWQNGDELRRSAVQMPSAGFHSHPLASLYIAARIIDGTVHSPWSEPEVWDLRLGEKTAEGWRYYAAGQFVVGSMVYRSEVSAGLLENWKQGRPVDAEYAKAFRDALAHADLMPQGASGEIAPHLLDLIVARRYEDTVYELAKLPQLFIAV